MNSLENKMTALIAEVDIDSWLNRPAVTSRGKMYLIEGTKIVGKVSLSSAQYRKDCGSIYGKVSISPYDEAAKDYFKEDQLFQKTGILLLNFDGVFGNRWLNHQDGNDPRYPNLRIVDQFEFDFGICHPFFSDVEGFDSYHKEQNHLRIRTKHKARKRRSSNKIKKTG